MATTNFITRSTSLLTSTTIRGKNKNISTLSESRTELALACLSAVRSPLLSSGLLEQVGSLSMSSVSAINSETSMTFSIQTKTVSAICKLNFYN